MADLISTRMPREIFDGILDELTKRDLKALAQVSRASHTILFDKLWRSVTITPVDEYHQQRTQMQLLSKRCLENAQELHFRANFQYSTTGRCLHGHKESDKWYTREGVYQTAPPSEEPENSMDQQAPFDSLSDKAASVLAHVKPNSLSSFSWDLGTCIPAEILGANGILPRNHPNLESLSVSNDFRCNNSVKISTSAFHNLRRLRWRAPNGGQVDALADAIENNASHLKELEIDFADWKTLQGSIQYPHGGLGGDIVKKVFGVGNQDFVTTCTQFVGIPTRPQGIIFQEIRSLSLTEVPLTAGLAQAINFKTLESLKLRTCPDWFDFLNAIVENKMELNLKVFEMTDDLGEYHKIETEYYDACVASLPAFLHSFRGLEQLYLAVFGFLDRPAAWREFASYHGESLKRFVFHERFANWDRQTYGSGEVYDNTYILYPDHVTLFEQDPSQNPLSLVNLDFFGICCEIAHLKHLLSAFKERKSLKVLHIRQSSACLEMVKESMAMSQTNLEKAMIVNQQDIDSIDFNDTRKHVDAPKRPIEHNPGEVRSEFLDLVGWAFGAEGIHSLDVLAFGDFSYGCREPQNNLVFFRNHKGNKWAFSRVGVDDEEWKDVLDRYGEAIVACPTDSLLHTRIALARRIRPS